MCVTPEEQPRAACVCTTGTATTGHHTNTRDILQALLLANCGNCHQYRQPRMKCLGSTSAVEGWMDSEQGLPMWAKVRFWVWGFLRQQGGHCHRVPGSSRSHGTGELGNWGWPPPCCREDEPVVHVPLPPRCLTHWQSPEKFQQSGQDADCSGAGKGQCRIHRI